MTEPLSTEKILASGWCHIDIGICHLLGRVDMPRLDDMTWTPEASSDFLPFVKSAMEERQVKLYWPIRILKVEANREAYMPVLPNPVNMDKTAYRLPYVYLNTSQVVFWMPIFPLLKEGLVTFFKSYLEDIGGRVAVASQMPPAPPKGGPMSRIALP